MDSTNNHYQVQLQKNLKYRIECRMSILCHHHYWPKLRAFVINILGTFLYTIHFNHLQHRCNQNPNFLDYRMQQTLSG